MHFGDPVAQRIGDQLQGMRRAHKQRVSGAGGVEVVLLITFHQSVVGGVVDTLEAQSGAHMVALGGVVVHHVKNDLHAGMMICLDHGFELVDLFAAFPGRGIGVVRCEEADGVVSPVVRQTLFLQEGVVDELVNRHQFNSGDAKLFQIFDDARISQARVGAADIRRHIHVEVGHAAHMRLINHRIMVRNIRMLIIAPIEVGVDDRGLHGVSRRVEVVHRRVVVRTLEPVREQAFVAVDIAFDGLGIWVEQQLVRIAPQTVRRVVRPVDAVTITLPGLQSGNIVMPYVGVLLGHLDTRLRIIFVEQTQLHLLRNLRVQREIHTGAVIAGTQRIH